MTIQEFITKHNLAITFKAFTPPAEDAGRWTKNHVHLNCSIGRKGSGIVRTVAVDGITPVITTFPAKCLKVEFHCPRNSCLQSKDERIADEARAELLESVLDCVAGDCRLADDHDTWEEMAAEFIDLKTATYAEAMEHQRIFAACERQAKQARRFFGAAAYAELLECESL